MHCIPATFFHQSFAISYYKGPFIYIYILADETLSHSLRNFLFVGCRLSPGVTGTRLIDGIVKKTSYDDFITLLGC